MLIATPGAARDEQVNACLDAGEPVLCEKPLIQVGFMRRFDAEYVALTPHAFHQGHPGSDTIAAGAEKVRYVHLADAWDHTASNGLQHITNPPGNPVRGINERQRDKALALVSTHFGDDIRTAVTPSTINK